MRSCRSFRYCVLLLILSRLASAGAVLADTVMITGANSGIGLEFTKQYAAQGWTVIATHRRDQIPDTLKELADQYSNLRVERMDVTDQRQIEALADKLKGTPIDVLINNAGIATIGEFKGIGVDENQTLGTLNYDQFDLFIRTNVRGPIMISEAFLDNVKASKQKKIIAISSASGMVSATPPRGGMYWYGVSKAALNKLMVTLSADVREAGVIVVMFHPGAVRVEKFSELDWPGMEESPEAIGKMMRTIDGLTLENSGKFLRNTGEVNPW